MNDGPVCPRCGQSLDEPRKPYETYGATLLMQTPQSVWREYRENGYTIQEAIREEWSYA